jgi:hypothetical protein
MTHLFEGVKWHPQRSEVRAFGGVLMAGFLGIGLALWLLGRWKNGRWDEWPWWLGASGVALGAVCWALPQIGRPIYVVWHAVGAIVSFCVTTVLLVAVFYLVITPIGLALRALGRDPLERKWDRDAKTYWRDAEKPVDAERYFRQF